MTDLGKAIEEFGENLDWMIETLKLPPEEAAKFRAETAAKMQDAIERGFRQGAENGRKISEWEAAHPGHTHDEFIAFYRTLYPQEVAWDEWREANSSASRYEARDAYEEIYGFEPDADDVEEFEPDPFYEDD